MATFYQKNFLRSKFKIIRDKTSPEMRDKVSKNVEKYLNKISLNKKFTGHIGIYWPIRNEIDLRNLKQKYSLALPKCQSKKKLEFYIWDKSPLKEDIEGIPSPDNNYRLNHTQLSILFIPCLSIDKEFNRLGYGGGYYDRLRADKCWNRIPAIGVLTSECIFEDLLTCSEFDIPLTGYITDKEIVV